MNICLLTRHPGYRGTGITRMATETLVRLVEKGHNVQVIATKNTSLPSYLTFTLLEIPLRLPKKGIDVYHAATSPMEGIWLPKGKSIVTYCDIIPILHTDRFGSGMGYSEWKKIIGKAYSRFGWRTASKARILTCTSEHVRRELIKLLNVPQEKVRVIRMGIRGDLNPQKKKDKTFRIGTLGQLDKRKRIDLLISQFKASKLDAELVIAGQGMDRLLLEEIANGDRRVKFLGLVADDELADFYNSLDAFVFPTWIEGYGLPIVEAMACKKPVVVLADAIIPDEIKSRCIVTDSLASIFSNMTGITNLTKSENGVDYEGNYNFAKEHDWDKCINEYIELYQEIVG